MINKYKDFTPEALEYMHGMSELRYEIFDNVEEAISKCFAFRDLYITTLEGSLMCELFPVDGAFRWDVEFGRNLYDMLEESGKIEDVIFKVRAYEKDNNYKADRSDTELLDVLTYMFVTGALSEYISDCVYYSINAKLFQLAVYVYPYIVADVFYHNMSWRKKAFARCGILVTDIKPLGDGKVLVEQIHLKTNEN